ncbi:hypothetical protein [Paeniglutamicibacter cryotolerans]|uniref:Uncharacterized protein n=1 Tax=Paeniglutamicibacter cryotolerans TaxID=670079 RepID=A0A839QHL7_9MICC|nr:hypothetical protein [Paeniglutamicibacter cryotolerans]MBB2993985.1 hypothetical protein [Paeniglutamicibacter cryotolerans]
MTSPASPLHFPARIGTLILTVFAAGAVPGAVLELMAGPDVDGRNGLRAAVVALPMLISLAAWFVLRRQKEVRGVMVLQVLLAAVLGLATAGSAAPLSWYLGAGLVLWAMRLGRNELMWVGTVLLVLCAGVQFGMLPAAGFGYVLAGVLAPLILTGAAAYSWWRLRTGGDIVREASAADELHRSRYGTLPGQ